MMNLSLTQRPNQSPLHNDIIMVAHALLQIGYWNACSIVNKIPTLLSILVTYDFDIFIITETWLSMMSLFPQLIMYIEMAEVLKEEVLLYWLNRTCRQPFYLALIT